MIELSPDPILAPPYEFGGPYAHCFDHPETATDRRHIFIIHEILKAWPFTSALEIGSFQGASATAFVEAINAGQGLGQSGTATFCDVSVSESLMDVVRNCRDPSRMRITPQPSWQVLASKLDFDFVFIDAAHDEESVSLELKHLLRRRPLCVMAHDTNATKAGYSQCEGALALKQAFQFDSGYWCFEDSEYRERERTERGLFFATTDARLYRVAEDIFRKWQ